jgi:S-adenosylmethionine:tRNA ribosyltransferase-isomerase
MLHAGHSGAPHDPLVDFDYSLPESLIARYPPNERAGGRLLDLRGEEAKDRIILDLVDMLREGDLLVMNNTRVLHARLRVMRQSGGIGEVLLLGDEGSEVQAMVRPGRRLKEGERLLVLRADGSTLEDAFGITLLARGSDGTWRVRPEPSPRVVMAAAGEVPLPPYLGRSAEPADSVRYQTVFAAEPGSVAAPTAGLHLDEFLLSALRIAGVDCAFVTLHVGMGTFRNLQPEDIARGELHEERWHIPEETALKIAETRRRGGRVIAVGTTSTRTLESAAIGEGRVGHGSGKTRIFIRPGYRFQVIDGLFTNLHLPRSSLLMLVCAFAGKDRVLRAYTHAVAQGYRFFSYGDAMLVLPSPEAARCG